MKITALAPWFGAKRNLAERIVAELGPHRSYWEPFCGSMAVLLSKPVASMETVNDLHGDLINLARVIKHATLGPMLYRRLRRSLFDEKLLEDAREQLRLKALGAIPDVDRAYAYFCGCWIGRNGNAGLRETKNGGWVCVRWTSRGGTPGTRWAGAVNSIPEWRRRLANVTILNRCGMEMVERIEDDDGAVIYCDPPYLAKSDTYMHDFADADHVRLAAALGRFRKTRVVVSYYDHPRLAELYPGWTKRVIEVSKSLVAQGRRDQGNNVKAQEALLINGPSLVEEETPAGRLFT